jgi:hypothetical protein
VEEKMFIEQSLEWVKKTWSNVKLGDKRRNQRTIKLANHLLRSPAVSLPQATLSWSDLKGAYRLLNEEDVTHQALQENHWAQVLDSAKNQSGPVLFIQDGSVLDYSNRKGTSGLGPIGNHEGDGINLHSCLVVSLGSTTPAILGLAYQKVWVRPEKSKRGTESRSQRHKRPTEADVWSNWIPPIDLKQKKDAQLIFVGDRGNDIFKFIDICKQKGWDCLYRACQNRVIHVKGEKFSLMSWIRSLSPGGMKEHMLRSRHGKPARPIELKISWGEVEIQPPQVDKKVREPIIAWCIRCWSDEENLEWILITTIPVLDSQSAIEKAEWYSHRWIIEEYHKCLKTGCAIEKSHLQSGKGLMALAGILGIIATKLLELRSISRASEDIQAEKIVPEVFIRILARKLCLKNSSLTMKDFWKQVARLGGFIGRKSDGDPGWQTLWGGWLRLLDMAWAVEKCG